MTATACGYEYGRTHARESAQMLIDEPNRAAPGTFLDTGLVFASQAFLSPRYGDPGRKWGWAGSCSLAWLSTVYSQFGR